MSTAHCLPGPHTVEPSPKSVSFAGAFVVTNALVTALATAAAPVVLSGAGLTGAQANPGPAVFPSPVARTISVTTAAHAATYVLAAITITGTDANGDAQTDTLTPTLVNGGETLTTSKYFATVTSISIPAQNDTLGSWTFGVQDIGVPYTREIIVGTAGTLHVFYGNDSSTDTIPTLVITAQPSQPINVQKILKDSTAASFTLYF